MINLSISLKKILTMMTNSLKSSKNVEQSTTSHLKSQQAQQVNSQEANNKQGGDSTMKNKAFSRKELARLTQGMLNDYEYEAEVVKTKDGKLTKEKKRPIEKFRKEFIEKVLVDNGVDKTQAEKAKKEYKFSEKQADALYEVASETAEKYMRKGFSYKFLEKDDFSASIKMKDVKGGTVTSRVPGSKDTVQTKIGDHKVLVKKSGAPKSKKTRLN